jgi:hypothetical protein
VRTLPDLSVTRFLGGYSQKEDNKEFEPTPGKLIPEMSQRKELVLLARRLCRERYSDHLAGHITCNWADGTSTRPT